MGSLKIAKNWKTVFLLRVFIRVPWTREPHNLEMPKTQNRQCSDEKSKKHPRDWNCKIPRFQSFSVSIGPVAKHPPAIRGSEAMDPSTSPRWLSETWPEWFQISSWKFKENHFTIIQYAFQKPSLLVTSTRSASRRHYIGSVAPIDLLCKSKRRHEFFRSIGPTSFGPFLRLELIIFRDTKLTPIRSSAIVLSHRPSSHVPHVPPKDPRDCTAGHTMRRHRLRAKVSDPIKSPNLSARCWRLKPCRICTYDVRVSY